ncbi:MAG: cytidine deaminase [Bacteroidetes bacterium]|nr:cytidine deaminase [Bacteroidota bacterium]HET6243981.1 cytidine deaminase [Bacteroidia bacterium]
MKKQIEIRFQLNAFDTISELDIPDQILLERAVDAAKHAYAPYSGFNVGAAVLLEGGMIVIGSNQENAAYPSGLCAERVAIFAAGAQFPGISIKSIAITANSKNVAILSPVAPCGACRQVLVEYEKKNGNPIKLILKGEHGKVFSIDSVVDLLPLVFDSSNLGI